MKFITSAQCRAARGLLNWSQPDLATRAGMHIQTISNFEAEKSTPSKTTLEKMMTAFKNSGVELLDNGGVIPLEEIIKTYRGEKGFKHFMFDVYETCRDIGGDVFVTNVDEALFDKWGGDDFINNIYLKNMHALPKKSFKFHTIVSENDTYSAVNTYSEYKCIPKKYWSPIATYIYGDKMANLIFTKDDVLIRVYNQKDFVDAQRKTAIFMWDLASSSNRKKP